MSLTVEDFVRATAAQALLPEWVVTELSGLPREFTGRVEFNYFRGGIANLNIIRSVKPT